MSALPLTPEGLDQSQGSLPEAVPPDIEAALAAIDAQTSTGISTIAGPEMADASSSYDAQRAAGAPLGAPEVVRSDTPVDVVPHAVSSVDHSGRMATIDVHQEAGRAGKWALAGAGTGAAVYGGLGAMAGLEGGAATAAALGAVGAAGGAFNFGLGALTTYGMGVLHNVVWHKDGKKKPGAFGTMARGIISPISVPLGLITKPWRK